MIGNEHRGLVSRQHFVVVGGVRIPSVVTWHDPSDPEPQPEPEPVLEPVKQSSGVWLAALAGFLLGWII